MADRPIQVGDLVMVVRGGPCCGSGKEAIGTIFSVTAIFPHTGLCRDCKNERSGLVADSTLPHTFFISRLKLIPPLSELEGERTQENLNEPA